MQESTLGFFVKRRAYGISGKRLTFYTEKHGLLDLIQFSSKKSSPLFPFGLYEVRYTKKPPFTLGKIEAVSFFIPSINSAYTPVNQSIFFFACDVVHQSASYNEIDRKGYDQLFQWYTNINSTQDPNILLLDFLIHWMEALGILPEFVGDFDTVPATQQFFHTDQNFNPATEPIPWESYLLQSYSSTLSRKKIFNILVNHLSQQIPNFDISATRTLLNQILK